MPDEEKKTDITHEDKEPIPVPRWKLMEDVYEGMNKVLDDNIKQHSLSIFERKVIMMMLDNNVELDKTNSMLGFLFQRASEQQDKTNVSIKGKEGIYR